MASRIAPRGATVWLRALLPVAAVVAAVAVLLRSRDEERALLEAVRQASPLWLVLAAATQALYLALYAGLQRAALRAADADIPLRRIAELWARSLAANAVAPGAGGAAMLAQMARDGIPVGRAAAGLALARVADLSGFALLLAVGTGLLGGVGRLAAAEAAAGGALLLVIAGWTLPLALAAHHPQRVERQLGRIARLGRRMRLPIPDGWESAVTEEARQAGVAIAGDPGALVRLAGFSLLAHLVDMAAFALLLPAFGIAATPGVALAGFGAAVLFWVVTIAPEGIGTSEGAAALAMHALGVPLGKATAVALAFRGLAFYMPLAVGVALVGLSRLRPALSLRVVPRLMALLAVTVGGVDVLSAVQPALMERRTALVRALPEFFAHGSRLAAAFAGFALLVLSVGLWRRKRAAWILTQGALLLAALAHLGKGLDWEEATLSVALLFLLLASRSHFHSRSDMPTVRRGLATLAGALVFTLAYGTAGFYLLDTHYRIDFSLHAALGQTVRMFVAFDDPHLEPTTGFGAWFADSIYVIAAGAFGYGLVSVLTPVLLRRPATDAERARATRIVTRHGASSVARFALFDDKSYWFSEGGSVVAYAVSGRVAVALGDPIGPDEDAAAAVAGFCALCERNDWVPAFYHVLPQRRAHYAAAGMTTLCVGHEAVIDLAGFTLAGGARKSLRRNVARATDAGFQAQVLLPPHGEALLDELEAVSDAWLETRGGREKQFSLGWFDREYMGEGLLAVVRGPDGRMAAFANVISEYQLSESSIDLMRRADPASGVMELLLVTLVEWAREQGFATFNLGLAPLAQVGVDPQDHAIDRAIRFLYDHLNAYYGFHGLHAFKDKFAPRWEPRYLAVPAMVWVPAAALAVVRADNGNASFWHLAFSPARRGR